MPSEPGDRRARPLPAGRSVPFGAMGPMRRELRRRGSLRPLWFTMPLVVAFLCAAAVLIALPLWSGASVRAFERGDLAAARAGFERQSALVSRGSQAWVGHYNLGTVLLAERHPDAAVGELERAIRGVPRAHVAADGRIERYSYECRVRMNLGLGLEQQGDARVRGRRFAEAAGLYERGAALVRPCEAPSATPTASAEPSGTPSNPTSSPSGPASPSSSPSGSSEAGGQDPGRQAGEARNRMERKSQQARERASGTPAPTPSPSRAPSTSPTSPGRSPQASPSPTSTRSGETPAERRRRELLEKRNRDAQERQREQQEQQYRDPGSQGW